MRLFIGIRLPDNIRRYVHQVQQGVFAGVKNVKLVEFDNLHITLKFLGQTEQARLPAIENAIEGISRITPCFELSFCQIGCFPNKKRPRIVWVGLDNTLVLLKIIGYLEDSLSKAGFIKEERKVHPHITIGRIKSFRPDTGLLSNLNNCRLPDIKTIIDTVSLFNSLLTNEGPVYEEIYKINLKDCINNKE